MNLKPKEHEKHLTEIVRLLSMYQSLTFFQFAKLFPELPEEKLLTLIRRLEKNGRLIYLMDESLLLWSKDCEANPATIASFWVLLDFQSDIIYHTVSEFPVTLTFYTQTDAYDVIYVPEEKEMLINHALSANSKDAARKLVIIERPGQIPKIHFPGIAAFCTVTKDGQVQYYRKQGVTDN